MRSFEEWLDDERQRVRADLEQLAERASKLKPLEIQSRVEIMARGAALTAWLRSLESAQLDPDAVWRAWIFAIRTHRGEPPSISQAVATPCSRRRGRPSMDREEERQKWPENQAQQAQVRELRRRR